MQSPGNGESKMRGQTILITGGGSGIGRAAALLCAERGSHVAVLDRDGDRAQATAAEARLRGVNAVGLICDVAAEDQVVAAHAASHQALGAPDGLFCAAGIDVGGFVHELDLVIWEQVMATNLRGVFLSCKHALRSFLANNTRGSIVCTSSPAALRARRAFSATNSCLERTRSAMVPMTWPLAAGLVQARMRERTVCTWWWKARLRRVSRLINTGGFLQKWMVIRGSSSLPAMRSHHGIRVRSSLRTERTNAALSAVFKRDLHGSQHSLDHLLVLGETHLRRILLEYTAYFNHDRPL
jgi:NAD(P)-dependent dehydrogenase (short-subunit alcohol dehydrogenase family)